MSDTSPRYVVIGGGMAGILCGIKLNQRGFSNYVIYEKRGGLGGTWRDNRYPGLTCDVPSHAYTYSFAPNPDWSSFFSPGAEIRDYFERMADEHGVSPHIRLNSEVVSCVFDDADGRWRLTLADGRADVADAVIAATGVLHHPRMPDIEGLEAFEGPVFHSAQWDETADLRDRRVGVVGTGSTGVQIVGAVADEAACVTHFVRSAQWIMPGKNYAYSDEQRARFRDDLAAIDEIRYGRYLGFFKRHTTAVLDVTSPEYLEIEGIVAKHLAEKVPDPALREKLTPDYKVMCKRLVVSSTYYDVVQRPDVHLALGPIARAEPNGLRTQDGVLHELDALILATGFKADSFIRPTVVKGRGGRDLDGLWADGPKAYLSISAPGFPNFFFLNGPNAPVGNFSLIDIAERQWAYVDQVLAEIEAGRLRHAAAKDEALAVYEAARKAAASTTVFASGCSSWYVSANGEPRGWPWSYDTFLERMAAPDWSDYEVS